MRTRAELWCGESALVPCGAVCGYELRLCIVHWRRRSLPRVSGARNADDWKRRTGAMRGLATAAESWACGVQRDVERLARVASSAFHVGAEDVGGSSGLA